MKTRGTLILGAAFIAGAAIWFLFRPERLFVDRMVAEPLPAAEVPTAPPTPLVSGRFRSKAHATTGVATVFRLSDGRRVLHLSEFATSNGPDVRVYLRSEDGVGEGEGDTQVRFVDLGALKGNLGDQNYEVPEGVDLARLRIVSIWCRRFSVDFGDAVLGEAT